MVDWSDSSSRQVKSVRKDLRLQDGGSGGLSSKSRSINKPSVTNGKGFVVIPMDCFFQYDFNGLTQHRGEGNGSGREERVRHLGPKEKGSHDVPCVIYGGGVTTYRVSSMEGES